MLDYIMPDYIILNCIMLGCTIPNYIILRLSPYFCKALYWKLYYNSKV